MLAARLTMNSLQVALTRLDCLMERAVEEAAAVYGPRVPRLVPRPVPQLR